MPQVLQQGGCCPRPLREQAPQHCALVLQRVTAIHEGLQSLRGFMRLICKREAGVYDLPQVDVLRRLCITRPAGVWVPLPGDPALPGKQRP